MMTATPVLERAVQLGAEAGDAGVLMLSVEAEDEQQASIISVTSTGDTGQQAASRASKVVEAYRDLQRRDATERLQAAVRTATPPVRAEMEQRAAAYGDGVLLVEQPRVERESPLLVFLLIFGVAGLLAGWLAGFLMDQWLQRPIRPVQPGGRGGPGSPYGPPHSEFPRELGLPTAQQSRPPGADDARGKTDS